MSDPGYEMWKAAKEADGVSSIPDDVAKAAIRGCGDFPHKLLRLAPVQDNRIVRDQEYTVYKIRDSGVVMYHELGSLTLAIGWLEGCIKHIVENTEYVITDMHDESVFKEDEVN